MNPYDFVHLALHALGGEVCGRTKLQKTIYFLGILTGKLDDLGYRAHYYGPYSDAVAAAVNRLKSLGFVQESALQTGACDAAGFEIARSDFKLTAEGEKIAKLKATECREVALKIKAAATRLKSAGDIDYMKMSVAAKTFFLLSKKGKPASFVELEESAKNLGWSPKAKEIAESVEFLSKLALASAKPA